MARISFLGRRGKRPKTLRCFHCKGKFSVEGRGRLPRFCSHSCRQRAYDQRKRRGSGSVAALFADLRDNQLKARLREFLLAEYNLTPCAPLPEKPTKRGPLHLVVNRSDDEEKRDLEDTTNRD
jgi:hypothetical protein